jgi:anaphase-promoting complex subunit 2
VVTTTLKLLESAQAMYLQPLTEHVFPILEAAESQAPGHAAHMRSKCRREIHSMFLHRLPSERLSKTLSYVLYDAGCKLFRLHVDATMDAKRNAELRKATFELLNGLKDVGLGRSFAQRAFAHAMDKLMGEFVVSHYMKVDWHGRRPVTARLRQWVKEGFAPLVKLVLKGLEEEGDAETASGSGTVGDETEIQQWQEMAIGRLGRARVDNLFDFIVRWDQSMAAILDLKVRKLPTLSQFQSGRLINHRTTSPTTPIAHI